ncbi:SDR family oxidoreductase [Chlorobium phaeovibrioides]|uniref:SDR family oxidoreductase n=1 Tax=Chlorobium phaeovibrioides TaxID=1094 RepID=UPI000F82C0B6|nr:SDR family oxidoreductase [Chlorobium phaeovibrioides]RTY34221.1 SDR family oxidoreductase [Chlorobium phaeovibrioides]
MKPRILVTGGSGLLAINWAIMLRDSYSVVLALHDRIIDLAGVETTKLNLDSVDDLVCAFDTLKPDIVVHTASLTSVEKCESSPTLAQFVNVELASNVAKASAIYGLPLVHISTDHLFQGVESLLDEPSAISPVNVYGRTKADAESRVLDICPGAMVIRTNFYGWGTRYRHSFSDVIINALRSGKALTLFHDVFYTPILIEELVLVVHQLLEMHESGVFHVVGDERISKFEFGMKLAREFSLDTSLITSGSFADQASLVQRPHDMSLSNQNVCKLLGRKLGDVNSHLSRLHLQEKNGLAQKLQEL